MIPALLTRGYKKYMYPLSVGIHLYLFKYMLMILSLVQIITLCEDFVVAMHGEFEMSMMGKLTYFLGLQVKQLEQGTFLSQSKYCFDQLKKFKMEHCKEVATPISTNFLMDSDEAG